MKFGSGSTFLSMLLFILLGLSSMFFVNYGDNPTDSRRGESVTGRVFSDQFSAQMENDSLNGLPNTILYSDSFNGANDTNALKSRGYKTYYRGTGPQGLTATWFQGSSIVFPALNGPSTGYVAANFNAVTSQNNIDNWMITPSVNISVGDSMFFFSRSILNSRFADSIRVMYSQAGDSVPEALWTELGRFKVTTSGMWQKRGFRVPSAGIKSRFAIRYCVVNGGPSGVNSDYIGIDSLTVERPIIFPNNVHALSIFAPQGLISGDGVPIAPKSFFTNIGSNSLTNFNVRFTISGPVNYSSTKTISLLNPGDTIRITFDSTFIPSVGDYTCKSISLLANDTNRYNDTTSSVFSVRQIDFGSGGGYFYANSTALNVTSRPDYCFYDTSGSTSLIVNGSVARPDLITGNVDDGFFRLGNILKAGHKFIIGGVSLDSIFIGTNGIIGFSLANKNYAIALPDTANYPSLSVFPLWMDLSFVTNISQTNRLSIKNVHNSLFVVTYDRVNLKGGGLDDFVTFQVLIDVQDPFTFTNSRFVYMYENAAGGRTGSSFVTKYNNLALPPLITGIGVSPTAKCLYRYSFIGSAPYAGKLFATSPVAVGFGPDQSKLLYSCSSATLNLTCSLEAITPDLPPASNTGDTILVFMREQSYPYEVADVRKIFLNNAGTASVAYSHLRAGRSYFIAVGHRNSIETWSSSAILVPSANSTVSYNFTTGVEKAFGSNMNIVQGNYCFYTGDINGDFSVDGTDLSAVDNDANIFASGYINSDVNNDFIVDGTDALYVDNNATNFIGVIRP